MRKVVHHARLHGSIPANPQDPAFATRAPMIRKAVVLTEEVSLANTSLVVSIVRADRHGIVSAHAALTSEMMVDMLWGSGRLPGKRVRRRRGLDHSLLS